jgi:hypothetical protein
MVTRNTLWRTMFQSESEPLLFGRGARVCAQEIDLSRDHVRVQPILADGGLLPEGAEEAAFIRAVNWSSYFSDIHG